MASQNTKPALWKASAWLLVAVSFALGALQVYRLGNLAVSISLCLVSLAICSYVVYLSYPHVTQWILDRRSHLPWGYRLTREGVFYSLVVIVVASAAAFSGNNLLYLVFSCLLAAILLAGFVSRLVLSGLQLDVRMPDHIFARQPVGLRVTLKNLKRLLPSFLNLDIDHPGSAALPPPSKPPQRARAHRPGLGPVGRPGLLPDDRRRAFDLHSSTGYFPHSEDDFRTRFSGCEPSSPSALSSGSRGFIRPVR